MPLRLDSRAPDFAERFRAFLATKREVSADVEAAVRAIIADVAARGDRAVIELTRQFDRFDPAEVGLKVAADEINAAFAACDRRALDALILARDRIEAYHRRQLPADERFTDALGVELLTDHVECCVAGHGTAKEHARAKPMKSVELIAELRTARQSERQGRLVDGARHASMERKKREGYF